MAAAGSRAAAAIAVARVGGVHAARLGRARGHRRVDSRAIFGGLDGVIKGMITMPPVSSVLGTDAVVNYEEGKVQGAEFLMEGVNKSFKTLDIPFQLGPPKGAHDMSESGLRKRLKHLQEEQRLIEGFLGKSSPERTAATADAEAPAAMGPPKTMQTNIVEDEQGEEYFQEDALTRKLKKWYTIDANAEVPYRMMSSFNLYPQWIPWAMSGKVLEKHPVHDITKAAVGFGIKVPFLGSLGDDIVYDVKLEPPSTPHSPCRVYTISQQSRYMTRLVYDWRFVPLDDNRTKVILELEFEGRAHWCMPVWEALREQVVSNIYEAFCKRVVELQAAGGGDQVGRPETRPKLESLRAVLQGPMLRSKEAVVVTETNGRTIRHANQSFATMTGRPLETLPGTDIPDLLQTFNTDSTVLRSIGAAIKARLPATAILLNRNNAGQEFKNRFSLAPLDDDESDTGVVFWAILKVVENTEEQRLTLTSVVDLHDSPHWAPDYEHPDAIKVAPPAV